jgi:PAS domain S-box-containing protein
MAEPHEFTQTEIAFVSIAASHAAAVIENARLYSKVLLKKTELEREITERQLAEEALRESEERFRSLFDNLSVGVAMIERDGRVSAVNKTGCHFLDYSQEEVIGMPLSELIYPEDLDIDRDLFKPIIKGEEDHCLIDKRYVRKGGEIVWGRLHLSVCQV